MKQLTGISCNYMGKVKDMHAELQLSVELKWKWKTLENKFLHLDIQYF